MRRLRRVLELPRHRVLRERQLARRDRSEAAQDHDVEGAEPINGAQRPVREVLDAREAVGALVGL